MLHFAVESAIVYLDCEFNFIKVNQTYAAIENVDPEYFTGKNHFSLYANEENRAIFRRVVETGEPANYFAKPFVFHRHPEWGTTYWDWSLQPVRNHAGRIDGLIFCLVDVTKRQQAEKELQRVQEELGASQRLSDIGKLAAMVAHELRNPLAAIKIATYNIRHKEPGRHLATHLDNINSKVLESEAIITNLLFHARLKQPHCLAMEIRELLQECITTARARHADARVKENVDLAGLQGVIVLADPHQLRELFNNLLTNAYDAMAESDGCLEVSATATPQAVTIVIRDNGIGISAEELPRLFEAFYTTKAKGTGLGLPVCQQIVRNHRGTLQLDSQPQQGTTVSVLLPRGGPDA
ncbi:MAG: hypothetical protein A2107_10365 [Verrucomicrobia bacterium GWF2_62_7]|nr:MAG: hypothetical protein A2107_10365 [Verrucomicrobia bacterium GWF2_62_7]